jgi:ABC-2 type transport system permease protein
VTQLYNPRKACTLYIKNQILISNILVLVYRNLIAATDKVFLIWRVAFPAVYIFVVGYAYSALIGDRGIVVGSLSITYTSFIAAGMIGFNVMNASGIAGSIIWNDRRNGMFQQLLAMPFSRIQYVISSLVATILIGLASAALVILIGLPAMFQDISLTMGSLSYTFCAVVLGSIFFGSFTIILSTKIKTSEAHNVINTSLFLFFAFVSSAFYPTQSLPESLSIASYFNPLTYVVNITREGIFSQVDEFTNIEIFILILFSSSAFIIATRSIAKMRV